MFVYKVKKIISKYNCDIDRPVPQKGDKNWNLY